MDLKKFCSDHNIPVEELGPIGEVSDGFHTFDSLYRQRLILFASLVNTFPDLAWKSHKHSDGEAPFGGGWFIVGIDTPKGSYTYHYEDKDWDLFRCREVEKAPEWDGHTDKDVERLLSLTDEPVDWAGHEVALACAGEKENSEKPGDEDYGVACYKSALRAYRCLMRDGHSGFSIQITMSILNRLIDGKCLTPIEDTPDIWEEVNLSTAKKNYQCKRMSSLFKEVAPDGTVIYSDVNRVQVIDIAKPETAYTNGFVTRLIDRVFPITMPYLPSGKKFKVVREEFSADPKTPKDTFDTVAYLYVITPNGKTVELNGFFKNGKDGMVRIEKAEYEERKARRIDKK